MKKALPYDFLQVFRLSVPLEPMVVLGSSPFLLPLARLKDDLRGL